ncbi:uncharacterized protein [Oscarella lobularis]|uniref:uncharacterized protein n=1 Tax=Oscarella lobularis TaxID=121494 RepID=UPI0033134052
MAECDALLLENTKTPIANDDFEANYVKRDYGTKRTTIAWRRSSSRKGFGAFACLFIACCLQGISSGFVFATSYYIRPVERACTPPWSRSLTVYATAGMYLSQAAFGLPIGLLVRRLDTAGGSAVAIALVLTGFGFLLSGLPVILCRAGAPFVTEAIYFAGFALLGVANIIQFISVTRALAILLPNRLGFAGGIYGLCACLGSIAFGQVLVHFDDSTRLDAATMFFLVGIQSVGLGAIAAPAFSRRIQRLALDYRESNPGTSPCHTKNFRDAKPETMRLGLCKTGRFPCMFLGVVTNSLAALGVIAKLDVILTSIWSTSSSQLQPRSLLSFLSLGSYALGRVFWTGLSDRIGLGLTWRVSLSGVALFLLVLGLAEDADCAWLSVGILCVYLLFATAPKGPMPLGCLRLALVLAAPLDRFSLRNSLSISVTTEKSSFSLPL